jgi:predicted ester cyclase
MARPLEDDMQRLNSKRVALAAILLGGTVLQVTPALASTDDNKQIVRRFTEEVYGQRKRASIDTYVHEKFVDHSPGTGPDAGGIDYVKDQWDRNYTAFPDLAFTLDDVLAEGDKVVARWTSHSTFTGKLGDVAGEGQKLTVQGVSIFRIEDGKIIESWDFVDRAGMLLQAGFKLVPPEKSAAK